MYFEKSVCQMPLKCKEKKEIDPFKIKLFNMKT